MSGNSNKGDEKFQIMNMLGSIPLMEWAWIAKKERRFKNDFKLSGLTFFSWRVEEQNSVLDTSMKSMLDNQAVKIEEEINT